MSEKSYLDGLLEGTSEEGKFSLSDEELNHLDVSTVKDIEFTDIDVSDIDIDMEDIGIPDISELFVDGGELEDEALAPAADEEAENGILPVEEEPELEIKIPVSEEEPEVDFSVSEAEAEIEIPVLEEDEAGIPVPEESEAEAPTPIPEDGEALETEVPITDAFPDIEVLPAAEEPENVVENLLDDLDSAGGMPVEMEEGKDSDDFMDDVDDLLGILSEDVVASDKPPQNDDPESFFSLDGLMAMDDDISFEEENGSQEEIPDLLSQQESGDSDEAGEDSLEGDLMGILNEKTEEEKAAKKPGIIAKLFGNIHDAKSKRAHEKMLSDEERKALKKKEREEKKAAKKAMKQDPAYIAEQEAKKKEKEEKKAQAKAVKEAKKREKEELKKQRQAEEEAEALKDQGRINRVGAAIVFVCLGVFAASVIFGSNSFSYNQSVANAEEYFGNREYTEAYNEIRGIELKNEDIEMYDKIMTVMYVNKQLNSYNNYYAMQMYPEALDSLLKGLEKYDQYFEAAEQLGIINDLDYVRSQIIEELQNVFSLDETEAYGIINIGTQEEYSQKVIEAAQQ